MKKSFTILEILIYVTIVFIFSSVGIANYLIYNEQIKLKNEGEKFVNTFELTKKKATTSELLDKNCSNFNGYQLNIASSGKSYSINFICQGNPTPVSTYSLSKNISFSIGANSSFNFPPLGSGINITINSLQLKNSSINKCINISITSNGLIEVNQSLISC